MSPMRTHAAFNENNLASILNKHTPKKTKILHGDQKPHFNKNLRKQIMIRIRQISQKILVTLPSLGNNETWWQI